MQSLPQSTRARVQEDYMGAGMDKALQICKQTNWMHHFFPSRSTSIALAVFESLQQKGDERAERQDGGQEWQRGPDTKVVTTNELV